MSERIRADRRNDMSVNTKIKRRDFVKTASVAMIAAPTIVPSTVFGENAPSNRLTMGCIGLGGMGTGNLRGFLARDDVQIVSLCDVDQLHMDRAQNLAKKAYGENSASGTFSGVDEYKDFRDVIGRSDIDLITYAVPYHWHAIVAISAANAGKHIYGEKPVGHTIREGRAMVEAVKRNGIIWQTGIQQRSSEDFRFACELVLNGRIGKLHTIHARLLSRYAANKLFDNLSPEEQKSFSQNWYTLPKGDVTGIPQPEMPVPEGLDYNMWLGPAPYSPYTERRCHFNFRFNYDYGGGRLADWAPHHCDIGHWGMGMEESGPVELEGRGVFPRDGIWNTAITYKVTCTYENGVKMLVYDVGQPDCGVLFEGSEGWVRVGRAIGVETSPKSLVTTMIRRSEKHLYKSLDHKANFISCVKSGKETVAPIEHGHRATSVGSLCNIALRLKRKLAWDPVNERFKNDPEADLFLSKSYRSPWRIPV